MDFRLGAQIVQYRTQLVEAERRRVASVESGLHPKKVLGLRKLLVLDSNWHSSDHCLHRAQEEIRKAVAAPLHWLRVYHLEAAVDWIGRGKQLGGTGLWDGLGAEAQGLSLVASNDATPGTNLADAKAQQEPHIDDQTLVSLRLRRTV